jgi:hypothetical protein
MTVEVVSLSAIGSSNGWEVSLDEATGKRVRWILQIEGPSVFVSMPVPSPGIVEDLLTYLRESARLHRSPPIPAVAFPLGESEDRLVSLWRDDEFSDRCFLILETKSKTVVRITIGGQDWHAFVHALTDLRRELVANDTPN